MVYVLLVVLIAGLVLGYVGASVFGSPKAGQVRNATLKVGDNAPERRLGFFARGVYPDMIRTTARLRSRLGTLRGGRYPGAGYNGGQRGCKRSVGRISWRGKHPGAE